MAKKSGSKSSRSERRAGRKRAERAVEHGLPTRKAPPPRARAATPEPGSSRDSTDRSSDAPLARAAKPARIPTLVWVLGGALVILAGVYLLSRQRDQGLTDAKPAPEPPVAAASAAPAVEAEPAPSAAPAPEVAATPEPPAAVIPVTSRAANVSVTPPKKPVVVPPVVPVPVVASPSKPKALVAPSPAAVPAPAPVAVPAAPAPVATPAAPAAPAPPKPAAPKAPPTPPVDNPY